MNTFLISGIFNSFNTYRHKDCDVLSIELVMETGSGRKKIEVRFVGEAKNKIEEYDLTQLKGTLVAIDGYIGVVNIPDKRPYVNLCGTKLLY